MVGQLVLTTFLTCILLTHSIRGTLKTDVLASGANREAYVSLLYGDDFLTGIRVLGQSLKETGCIQKR
jgi:hypothetical protein